MNAKKKNKKANKPPNPNTSQSSENAPKPTQNVEEIQPKCEVKEEQILVPEICSDVVAVPVSDVKEIECEMPKKPKRNKGKKKKQDKDEESTEHLQENQVSQTETNVKVQEPIKKLASEDKETEKKSDPLDETNLVPSARKKKNKKKSQDKPTEESKIPEEFSVSASTEDTTETMSKTDLEVQELFSSTPETPKQDSKKKKNKKKNRNDSEKSDKSENVASCTSAFQNLLLDDEKCKQDKPDITVKNNPELITNLSLDTKTETAGMTDKIIVESQLMDDVKELPEVAPQDTKELTKDEGKGKKKNKKDKKQSHREIVEELKPDVSQEISITADDILTQKLPSDESQQNIKEFIEIPLDSKKQRETSPKLKAKIAKPVEKKRKDKLDAQSSENRLNVESSETVQKDKPDADFTKEADLKLEEIPTADVISSQVSDQMKLLTQKTFENINLPSESTMGKKRKKSPKPPKTKSCDVKTDIAESAENIKPKASEIRESSATVPDLIQSEIMNISSKSETIASKIAETPLVVETAEGLLKPQEHQNTDLPETKLLEQTVIPDMKTDDEGFETKISKKKKKTPKIPQIEETSEVKKIVAPAVIQKQEDDQEKSKQLTDEEKSVPLDLSVSVDLEVRSVRTESEASSCDLIPDVLFIRSSSQHLFDSNNNTVIQELAFADEIKFNDPSLLPLIEGSGETPSRTPEPVASGIIMTEIQPKTPTEEKTDIKSKMMEVNQDMEELRLSIERSLAEFTALEKCEEESEKTLEIKTALEDEKSLHIEKKLECTTLVQEENPSTKDKHKVNTMEETLLTTESKENIPVKKDVKESKKPNPIPPVELFQPIETPPVCPARKDNKGKSKSKKKGKQETVSTTPIAASSDSNTTQTQTKGADKKQEKSEEKSEQKTESSTQKKGKQQSTTANDSNGSDDVTKNIDNEKSSYNSGLNSDMTEQNDFDPIENFEDALTSGIDDVNITFEMIAKDADDENIEFQKKLAANKPDINITEPIDDTDTKRNEKVNPISQPKNLLGQIDFPVQSNKTDYKKEKNKTPNARQARVKIKDSMEVEAKKKSKESQTESKKARKTSDKSVKESFSRVKNDNDEYVYKYSFRKVFLQSACLVCNKDLTQVRVPCGYCTLVFYCGSKHKDEDWPQHQALCFAISTLAHMKDQKHIYADAQHAMGQDYRLLRMQMIVSCEKVLKRRLVPWEQEAMLYPRICADVACREWRQGKLKDCEGCGQLSYCAGHPDHLPKSHSRWCKSYSLYQKLVNYQQTKGRLEPRLPTKVMMEYEMPGKMNEVLAAMYEEKIDMNDIQYASLTQIATAPLTTAYCLQLCRNTTDVTNGLNGFHKKHPFTIHVVGAELQFEADALNKWEIFFLHLRPDVEELRVVLVSPMLNPGNLPLDLLGRIKLCDNCYQNKRRVVFKFEDNKNYFEYRSSEDFINPDIICAFNPSIQRSSIYNGKDPWPTTINSILKLKQPFIITSYTLSELRKDIARVKDVAEMDFKIISEPGYNSFASVRPDRNFISDDEMPLLFKNYCVAVLLGC